MCAGPTLQVGHVMHRRLRPTVHAFVYPVFFVRLPLSQLAQSANRLFSVDRFNVLSFHRRDHGPRDGSPLLPWIQRILREHGLPDDGEVVLQTFPRVFGFVFNPVSFWLCHNARGELIAMLAEVSNTFGERHNYLLHHPAGVPLKDGQVLQAEKALHVSPFNKVEGGYRFVLNLNRDVQRIRIDYADSEGPLLLTALSGKTRKWSNRALLSAVAHMPALTLGVVFRIHWQAVRLWLKKVPFVGARSPIPHQEALQGNKP
ncbi:cyclopropane fatty acid synthase [Hydrogenophaga crassostreae]|uniref:Cyclopropane fatty acid synthase n=2 Tax=Hydrogenophaga crassostreae TaxID=1763535 RepID=A0A167GUP7_9BURK|nr:cyclopropane fatty acid synthase [Hydrogenophaga crassostreae]OAD39911.1 cyclopropane fatty acid synthase [Hydrogenophaga crassostreae]